MYILDEIRMWDLAGIDRPLWMSDMIRKWMYNPPKPPLREWFRYEKVMGLIGSVIYYADRG